MRRLVATALTTAFVLTACGGTAHHVSHTATSHAGSSAGRLSIRPPAPTTASRMTFAFTARATSGRHGPSELSFVLTLAGPRHAGCRGAWTAPVPHAVRGRTASVVLGAGWCSGAYTARVQEFARPFCRSGQMCPQYVRLIGTVATASFRIASA